MPVFGVICEYDPFHLGHRWMLEQLHRQGPVVCAMSGCFTQRGEFAAVNKFARAEMAVRNGADLVLELPTPWAVSGAERFARGGVELAGGKLVVVAAALHAAPVHRTHQLFSGQVDGKLSALLDEVVAVPLGANADGYHAGLGADGAAPANRDQVGRPSRAAAYQHRRFRV